ncbi:MAG: tetratricopeptide repeat protein [Candidatus Cloacimonetes bacterium]|nr:tetratricopeptide repeat protein [Candidatus Cloacimonadota bacterium]
MFKDFDDFSFNDIFNAKPKYQKLKLKEGERRQVSILFADLKGFTSLSENLDSEEVHTILDEILQVFTKCIEHYGGDIDKYEGDLVMAHFGAIKASERDTERAISSALLMIQQLQKFNRKLKRFPKTKNVRLDVRIGINTGNVTTGKVGKKRQYDFTVYGSAVNLASRMESNAPLNRIMVPEEAKELVKDIFDFDDFGEIQVKGIQRPISVFLVKNRKKERIQRWEFRQSKLVGRDKELKILQEKFENIHKRNAVDTIEKPIVVGINGEPGIGKSRLIYEFLKKNAEYVLFGTTPKTYQIHFALFTSMLNKYFDIYRTDSDTEKRVKLETGYRKIESHLSDENDIAELRDSLPLIGFLFHISYDDPRLNLEGKELLAHIQTAIRHFIEAIAGEAQNSNSSLIVVWEDLHWLDDISKKTIDFLIETLNLEEKRAKKLMKNILFIFIYRPEYSIPTTIKNMTEFTEIELNKLDQNCSKQIIYSMTKGFNISKSTIQKVEEMSAGNPFYLEEWCNLVNDLGDKIESNNLPIPNSLNALILARIDRLNKDLKQLLQNASVIGREFLTKILAEVENRLDSSMGIDEFLNELETNEYLRRILDMRFSKYFFKHILTQEVAYRTILRSNRRILHKLIAEIIEEHFSDNLEIFYSELAHHYVEAQINDKAIEFLEKAGDQAKKNFDNLKALELFDKILPLVEKSDKPDSFRICIQLKMTEIMILLGRFKSAEELADALLKKSETICNKKYIMLSLRHLSHIHLIRNNAEKAYKFLTRRIEIAKEIGDQNEIMRVSGNISMYYWNQEKHEKALSYTQNCLKLAKNLNDELQITKAYTNLGLIYFELSDLSNSLRYSEMSVKFSRKNAFRCNLHMALTNLGIVYRKKHEPKNALKYFKESLEISEEVLDKRGIALALGNIGNIYTVMSNYNQALEFYLRTLKLKEEMGLKKGMAISCSTIARIHEFKKNYAASEKYCALAIKFGEKWKVDISSYLLQKANILFLQKKLTEAEVTNNSAFDIIKEFNLDLLKIKSEILREKINFMRNQTDMIPYFESLLKDISENIEINNEVKRALIYFEMYFYCKMEGKISELAGYRQQALKLNENLFNKTAEYEYHIRIDELNSKK